MKNAAHDFKLFGFRPLAKSIRSHAGKDRRHNGRTFFRRQNKNRVFRRLFENFQQRVPCAFVHALGVFQNDRLFSFGRFYMRPCGYGAYVFDRNRVRQKIGFEFSAQFLYFSARLFKRFGVRQFVRKIDRFHVFVYGSNDGCDLRKLVVVLQHDGIKAHRQFSHAAQKKIAGAPFIGRALFVRRKKNRKTRSDFKRAVARACEYRILMNERFMTKTRRTSTLPRAFFFSRARKNAGTLERTRKFSGRRGAVKKKGTRK